MNKQIKICESVALNFMPDTTIVSITVEAEDKKYDVAVELANDYLAEISDTLTEVGVLREDIKTTNFNICPNYQHRRKDDCEYVLEFMGYSCTHSIVLEFGCDAEFLSNILSAISKLDSKPDVVVTFKLNNTKEAERELIKILTQSALYKAKAFCDSLGVTLGDLVSIEYSGEKNENGPMPLIAASAHSESGGTFEANVTPKEVTMREHANFIWEFK